jgi:hypothetical protein
MNDVEATEGAAVDKKAVDVAVVRKATDVVAAAERATMDKRVTDAMVVKKSMDNEVVTKRGTAEVATRRVTESKPALAVGAKGVAISSSSTPPTKQPFRGS